MLVARLVRTLAIDGDYIHVSAFELDTCAYTFSAAANLIGV